MSFNFVPYKSRLQIVRVKLIFASICCSSHYNEWLITRNSRFFFLEKTFKPNLMTYLLRLEPSEIDDGGRGGGDNSRQKLPISSILRPFKFVNWGQGEGGEWHSEHYLPSLLMKLTRANSVETWPCGLWMRTSPPPQTHPGAKIFTWKTIAEKLVNLNEFNASTDAQLMRASPGTTVRKDAYKKSDSTNEECRLTSYEVSFSSSFTFYLVFFFSFSLFIHNECS